MAPQCTKQCNKCGNNISKRDFLTCEICDELFHLDCTDISFGLFKLMKSKRFKCRTCQNLSNENRSHSTPINHSQATLITEHINNITQRKPKSICNIPTSNSYELLSDCDEKSEQNTSPTQCSFGSLPETTTHLKNNSCPELTLNNHVIQDLLMKVETLELKLKSTENELDKQLEENYTLEKRNAKLELKIEKLSHICKSTQKPNNSPMNKKSRCRKRTKIDFSQLTYQDTTFTEVLNNQPENSSTAKSVSVSPVKNAESLHKNKNKICVISSNKYNKTRSVMENTLGDQYNIFHYLKPNCGIVELLRNIEFTVNNFTYDDFCVIFVGDDDFHVTKNFSKLCTEIKNALLKIQHTNIILCLPTFRFQKHSNLLFNWRVESFNNQLYWDQDLHDYTYLLDTNLHLDYSNYMYRPVTGLIKTNALRIISSDLKRLMNDIRYAREPTPIYNYDQSNKFFR